MTDRTTPAGFKGKLNIYTCQACRGHVVTRDLDVGTTPMFIGCKATLNCEGTMNSSMYRVWDQDMREAYQWYRPSAAEVIPVGAEQHVAQGGLLLREAVF